MPDISGTIRTITVADAAVSALIGTRMHSDALPQGATLPAITYRVISTVANEHLGGIADVSRSRIQIDSFGATRSAANALADAVRIALETKHRGDNSGQFINDISLASGEVHQIDRAGAGSDARRYITSQDFFVSYRTTTS